MNQVKSIAAVLGVVCCMLAMPVAAIPQLSFNPSTTNTTLGSTFSVDVVLSGLNGSNPALALSDFDLDVSYNSSLLSALGVSFGPGLGGPAEVFSGFDLSTPGIVDLGAFSTNDYNTLRGLQGNAFTLATLNFRASGLTPGTSLAFVSNASFIVDVISFQGQDPPVNLANPSSCAVPPCLGVGGARVVIGPRSVPEPTPLLLLGAAAVALMVARRRPSIAVSR